MSHGNLEEQQLTVVLIWLQAKKQEIVRVMGRAATASEAQKVMAEVAGIQADSAQADDTLAVSHRLLTLCQPLVGAVSSPSAAAPRSSPCCEPASA